MSAMQTLLGMLIGVVYGARREEGQTMAEYALILAGIAVVAMVGVALLGPAIKTLFTTLAGQI